MATHELDKLIVDHLADIESAAKRLDALASEVFDEIDGMAQAWANENGWSGNFDFLGKRPVRGTSTGLWFAHSEWRMPGTATQNLVKREFQGWFRWVTGTRTDIKTTDHFDLTILCREGTEEFGFAFEMSEDLIQWRNWKGLFKLTNFTSLTENTPFVVDAAPSFFFPVRLESAVLAQCLLEQSVKAALTPFKDALESIAAAKPAFDAVIAAAINAVAPSAIVGVAPTTIPPAATSKRAARALAQSLPAVKAQRGSPPAVKNQRVNTKVRK